MKKTTQKNLKPIEYDIHLKYRCNQCCQDHWLSFQEASTKNFKVVCDCGNVFKVKRPLHFKLKYASKTIKTKQKVDDINKEKPVETKPCEELLSKSVKMLTNYGFSAKEASDLICESYQANHVDELISLVKQTLNHWRQKNGK
jgi:hypothetical protein